MATYTYKDNRTKELILCGDDARFFNHTKNPNVVDDAKDPYQSIAVRDILAGEELTHDYFSFDLLARKKLGSPKS
jgi:SET domain-containing protein